MDGIGGGYGVKMERENLPTEDLRFTEICADIV
jgi:hypothetical protein